MSRPSLEVQAHNLAEIMAGMIMSFLDIQAAPNVLEGTTTFKRTAVSTFQMTTQSGTILEVSVRPVDSGH